jgi:hypothetical protein
MYLKKAAPGSRAWHSQELRIGFQRSAPQNNFRRIIAAPIAKGAFCFDTVSYIPASEARLPLPFILALLNSTLLEWYFRLGSSNSKLNEYQFNNLPCPSFTTNPVEGEREMLEKLRKARAASDWGRVESLVDQGGLLAPPFSATLMTLFGDLSETICAIEAHRGEISRAERAALDLEAQPIQDLIDRLLFNMAGFKNPEVAGILKRMEALV